MTSKTRDRLTTVMDVVMAGVLALVPVAVVGSWLVGAVVFALGVMWILRPKEPGAPPGQEGVADGDTARQTLKDWSDDWSDEFNRCQGFSYDYRNGFHDDYYRNGFHDD